MNSFRQLPKTEQAVIEQGQRLLQHLNSERHCHAEVNQLFSEIIGQNIDDSNDIFLPFHTNYGRHIKLGRQVMIDTNVTMLDFNGIEIGNEVTIGAGTSLISAENMVFPPDESKRVIIGQQAVIGANSIILPGVTIGKGVTIPAGSVINHDMLTNKTEPIRKEAQL